MIESLANFILDVMNFIANCILAVIKSIAIVVGSAFGFAMKTLFGSVNHFFDAAEKQLGINDIPLNKWERMTGESYPPPPRKDTRPYPTSPPPPLKKYVNESDFSRSVN
jgi:hypothetical protein